MASNLELQEAEDAIDRHREHIAELEAEVERLTKERDEAERLKINWFETHLAHQEANQALGKANSELLKRAMDAERRAEALSHTGAMKVDRQRLNMEISKWATDSDLHITIGDVEALHEAVLSALEPAAPEPKTLVHEPMVWTGRGPYGMSPAAPDNKTAVGYEPFTLFPDGSYERVQEGFGYRDENGQPQFQQTVPASEQAARRPSGKSPDDYRTDYEIGLDNGYALARPSEQAVTEAEHE